MSKILKSAYTTYMLILSSKLRNLAVLSLRTGGKIAVARVPLINPNNLQILGWWCESPHYKEPVVLLNDDVREMSPRGLIVDDNDALVEKQELVKLKNILDIAYDVMEKPVKTKHHRLGKVSDYSVNDGMFIQKLYVSKPLINIFTSDSALLVDRSQVLEVTDHYILIKDTEATEKVADFAAEPATT